MNARPRLPGARRSRLLHAIAAMAAIVALVPLALPGQAWADSSTTVALAGAPDWAQLSPAQREALAPLATQWAGMDPASRDKWIQVADRYPQLPADARQRMHSRMKQWSQVPPQERGEARLRYQNARQMSAEERQRKWAAYQALSPEERADLAQQARRKQNPVVLPDAEPGPREPGQSVGSRSRGATLAGGKFNVVPIAGHVTPPPQAVAPALVKAGPGATTSLVTETATPPLHQQSGLPKIAADRGFVDPRTLLPRKGAQSAAMTPVGASRPGSATVGTP